MPDPCEFTVAWICALDTEYVAAISMLDEKYDKPARVLKNDRNTYTLGRIQKHNVVIAALPLRKPGITPAAIACSTLLSTFMNIRVGLMVGIAGGAWSRKNDIRLGDVVVSTPGEGSGGVIQYDFGKTLQGKPFKVTGYLNQPSSLLLGAVQELKTQYKMEGHEIAETIDRALTKYPKLRSKFQRPAAKDDIIFLSNVVHPDMEDIPCVECCPRDSSSIHKRCERTEKDDDPTIHYGLMGSANQVMKDACIRDQLAKEKGVLCFETAAAGLMNQFPFLVIRGICDYADSHTNKSWQGYAAMTAAAYAKDLLCSIIPTELESENKILDGISDLKQQVNGLTHSLAIQDYERILQWLSPLDYATRQSDLLDLRQANTGKWFIESHMFKSWVMLKGLVLLCPGAPGAGKTFLTSLVIQTLQSLYENQNVGIAYVFCSSGRHPASKARDMLLSILKQLAQNVPEPPRQLLEFYEKRRQKVHDVDEISNILRSVLACHSRNYVLIDGLDDCHKEGDNRKLFMKALQRIVGIHNGVSCNLYVTSTFDPEIGPQFRKNGCLSIEITANREDVWTCLDSQMADLPSFVLEDEKHQEEIKIKIWDQINGLFLLAKLYFDSLVGKRTEARLMEALAHLPHYSIPNNQESVGVYESYDKAMNRIQNRRKDLARNGILIFSWLVCAKRPMRVAELQHALAVEPGKGDLDVGTVSNPETITELTAGLVQIDKKSQVVRLAHITLRQYFEGPGNKWIVDAEDELTRICITYLGFDEFKKGASTTAGDLKRRIDTYPFFLYAAQHWSDHARQSQISCDEILGFFKSDHRILDSSLQATWLDMESCDDVPNSVLEKCLTRVPPLHLAAYFGFTRLVARLIGEVDINSVDNLGMTPLFYAMKQDHKEIVQLLLSTKSVNLNAGMSLLRKSRERGWKASPEF